MKKLLQDFKEFALKGNVLDMAVGVIIGGAFGKIVTSLVNDILMPLLGLITGGVDFSAQKLVMSPAITEGGEVIKEEAALLYGSFVKNIIDFIIIALTIFIMVKVFEKAKKSAPWHKDEEAPAEEAPAPEPTAEEKLLTEIRDILIEKDKK